jgi:hypothetical protein
MAKLLRAQAFEKKQTLTGGGREVATRRTSKSLNRRPGKLDSNAVSEPTLRVAEGEAMPTADQIRQRAYEIFLARGRTDGDDWSDWFVAERQLVCSPPASKA